MEELLIPFKKHYRNSSKTELLKLEIGIFYSQCWGLDTKQRLKEAYDPRTFIYTKIGGRVQLNWHVILNVFLWQNNYIMK